MIELIAAFQFLTIFPTLVRRPFTAKELGRSSAFYPLVGLALGGLFFATQEIFSNHFSPLVSGAILLILWVMLTRAIHYDGFLDACDGLFGGFNPEKRMLIMRDSRVGAFALVGGSVLLITMFATIISSKNLLGSLILAPVFGRWGLTFALVLFPYAREEGMGKDIKDNSSWKQLLIASLTTLIIAWFTAQWLGILVFGIIIILSFLWLSYVLRLLPGLTGDIYGATCILIELMVLIIFSGNFILEI